MRCVGDFVLVKPETDAGVIILPDSVQPDNSYCRVIAVGTGNLVKDLKVGDRLMIKSGIILEVGGVSYLRCHSNEIIAVLDADEVFTDAEKSIDMSKKVLEKVDSNG